jgi:DNA-binding Lrp family transcriptional regulator
VTILDPIDRRLIAATEAGLPIVERPYAQIASDMDLMEDDVISRLSAMQTQGIVRRIALAPNHYRLGMTENGMTVWDVDDAHVSDLGMRVGALPFVTHCYRRPRALPQWRYNLFAMVHGSDRTEVEAKRLEIAQLLSEFCRANAVLYSTRILKKTGLRLSKKED